MKNEVSFDKMNLIKDVGTCHDFLRNGIDFVIHQKLLIWRQLHDNDAEVCTAQVKRKEFSVFFSIWQVSDVSWETFDT